MFIFEPQCHTLVTFFLNLPKWKTLEIEGLLVRASNPAESLCCVLEQDTICCLLLTQQDPSRHDRKIVDWHVKNQTKQTNKETLECSVGNWKYDISEQTLYIVVGRESKPCNSDFYQNDFLSMQEYQMHGGHSDEFS